MSTNPVSIDLDAILDLLAEKVAERLAVKAPAVMEPRKLLSIPQAARFMDRSGSSVRHLIHSGQIPRSVIRKFGKRIFLDRAELERWIAAQ